MLIEKNNREGCRTFGNQELWVAREIIIDNMAYMPYNAIRGKHMTEFTVIAYEKEDGESPVEDFINALDVKMRAKMYGLLFILQEKGNSLREPYSKHLDDGIFELRCKVGSNITRVLYFFYYEGKIILINGFVKKTQKTPPEEIRLAKERRADYIERMEQS
jgi:phage-related protein